jgi:hypothetical protein
MLRIVGAVLTCLLCLALLATGQEKKPAAPAVKKKPAPAPAADRPAAADSSNPDAEAVAAVLRSYRLQ